MFQTGGLIVFCGLLVLSLPLDLALSPTDFAGELTGALSGGLLSGDLLDTIKNFPLVDILNSDGDTSEGLVGKLLQQVVNSLSNLTGIKITKPKLLEIGLVPSKDGHRLYLNIPLGFDLSLLPSPLKVNLLKLSVKLNATVEVFPEKDENGVHLVLGDCSQAPINLEITLLNGVPNSFTKLIIDNLTKILSETIPKVVLSEVCSIVNGLLSQLDVSFVQAIVDQLIPQKDIIINI